LLPVAIRLKKLSGNIPKFTVKLSGYVSTKCDNLKRAFQIMISDIHKNR